MDTVGTVPSPEEVAEFLADDPSQRRSNAVKRLTDDPRWADHWVAYWQDVLAENPGILKPKINNTGPFRFWIHESFLDNKPIDRFVTELIMMEGSRYQGGPAGFGLATQNDVPMGAKAQIIAQAFLAVDMKCARCHDAPFQSVLQRDLFSMAALLKRSPQKVPATSSIPLPADELETLAVDVTLTPGESVEPSWPFPDLLHLDSELPDGWLRDSDDTRERLAAMITSPENTRFAPVVVNRLWQRYLGVGLVESTDDWELLRPTHPELLAYLAHELMTHDYDLKHVARLIFNSRAYQRQPASGKSLDWFAGPKRRRLSAEQIVDSLFQVAGKSMQSEPLTLDLDGRRDISAFLNLGNPTRAWEFTSLSNERDRPALAMPRAQSIVDVLETFGWRSSRQNPITIRAEEPTIQQPAILANGVLARRICGLSDDSHLTRLCLEAVDVTNLVEGLFLRALTRSPNPDEMRIFSELLEPGFDKRVIAGEAARRSVARHHAVSWSNHLSAEATRIKLDMERLARAGDPPTSRLDDQWRGARRGRDLVLD